MKAHTLSVILGLGGSLIFLGFTVFNKNLLGSFFAGLSLAFGIGYYYEGYKHFEKNSDLEVCMEWTKDVMEENQKLDAFRFHFDKCDYAYEVGAINETKAIYCFTKARYKGVD